jgi:hypothetical protein
MGRHPRFGRVQRTCFGDQHGTSCHAGVWGVREASHSSRARGDIPDNESARVSI